MQKEKKQSQLLATLSEILKLYHKYLLYSLRGDLVQDRKAGLLENVRDRIRGIAEKWGGQGEGKAEEEGNPDRNQNKLISRFLGRLSEKVKGYMEQYAGDEVPVFLTSSMKAIQKMSQNLNLPELLTNLFALGSIPKPKKQSRKSSAAYSLSDHPERRTAKASSIGQLYSDKIFKGEETKTGFLSAYTKKSNMIQEVVDLLKVMEVDEKELRRKYFAILQAAQQPCQSQNNLRPLHSLQPMPTYTNFSLAITSSQFPVKPESSQLAAPGTNLVVTNSSQYSNYGNNQLYQEMMERNRAIAGMIRKYETCYEKYRKREAGRLQKERDRDRDRERMRDKIRDRLSMPRIGIKEDYHSSSCEKQHEASDSQPQNEIITRETHRETSPTVYKDIQIDTEKLTEPKTQEKIIIKQFTVTNTLYRTRQVASTDNPSLPELKTLKFEYNMEQGSVNGNGNIHNLNSKNSSLNKKAEKLLRITKPAVAPQPKQPRKQKSISTSTLTNLNPSITPIPIPIPHTEEQQPVPPTIAALNNLNSLNSLSSYSQIAISANTYNNLNGIIRSKNLLNKLLNKVSSVGVSDVSGSIVCLSRLQIVQGDKDKEKGEKGEDGALLYGDHNIKYLNSHSSHDSHSPTRPKKPPLYRQELLERRAKVQAMYNKTKPSQLGILRSNINFPKLQQVQAPSFLMACRSYQKANELNIKNKEG